MITSKAVGTTGSGTTSAVTPFPAGVAAGDTLFLVAVTKYPSDGPDTPAGWTLLNQTSGGAGSPGADSGQVTVSVFRRTADGTESGSLNVTAPTANCILTRIYRYQSFGAITATVVGAANNTASTAWSVTFGSDPGIQSGDYCLVVNGVNTDNVVYSASALSTPGVTYSSNIAGGPSTSFGDGCAFRVSEHTLSTGVSTGASTYTMTGDSGAPSGASVLIVLREAAIQFGGFGAAGAGTGSVSLAYPANIAAGDVLVAALVNKYPTNGPATPSGWTLAAQGEGGTGASGLDTGHVYTTVFTKIADGTESGSLTVTITGGNSAVGRIARYFSNGGGRLAFSATAGSDNTAGTGWSVTGAANPGISAGNLIVAVSGVNTDGRSFSAEAVTATGCTFDTAVEDMDAGSTAGDDVRLIISRHFCMTGPASAAPVFTMTASGSDAATEPAGATVLLVLREHPSPAPVALPWSGLDASARTGVAATAHTLPWAGVDARGTLVANATPPTAAWSALDGTNLTAVQTTPPEAAWAGVDAVGMGVAAAILAVLGWDGDDAATRTATPGSPGAFPWSAIDGEGVGLSAAVPASFAWAGLDATVSTAAITTPSEFGWSASNANGTVVALAPVAPFSWSALDAGLRVGLHADPSSFGWAAVDASCRVNVDGIPADMRWEAVSPATSAIGVTAFLGWLAVDAVGSPTGVAHFRLRDELFTQFIATDAPLARITARNDMSLYNVGDTAVLSAELRVKIGGEWTLTDPTSLALVVRLPSGTESLASVSRSKAGTYQSSVDCTESGTWRYRWTATGAAKGVEEGHFLVVANSF